MIATVLNWVAETIDSWAERALTWSGGSLPFEDIDPPVCRGIGAPVIPVDAGGWPAVRGWRAHNCRFRANETHVCRNKFGDPIMAHQACHASALLDARQPEEAIC